jgi:hypothetical protein
LNGAVLAFLLRFAIQWLVQHRLLSSECARRQFPRQAADDGHALELFCRFSLPAAIAGCCSWPVLWLATACLARQVDGFHELALYTAANTLRMTTLFLPFTLSNFTWSRLNHERGLGDQRQSASLFRRNLLTTGTLSVTGSLAVMLAAPVLLPWFGKSFADGRMVLNVMMLAAIAEALTHASQQAMHSQSRIWRSLCGVALPRDLSIIVLAYGLTPRYGAVGLAMALGSGWSVALASSLWFAWRHRHGDPTLAAFESAHPAPSWQPREMTLANLPSRTVSRAGLQLRQSAVYAATLAVPAIALSLAFEAGYLFPTSLGVLGMFVLAGWGLWRMQLVSISPLARLMTLLYSCPSRFVGGICGMSITPGGTRRCRSASSTTRRSPPAC